MSIPVALLIDLHTQRRGVLVAQLVERGPMRRREGVESRDVLAARLRRVRQVTA